MSEAVKVEEGLYTRAKTLIVLVLGLRLRGCVARDDSFDIYCSLFRYFRHEVRC